MTDVHRTRVAPGPVDAVVTVPGSKSIANRALVCAALADGRSTLDGLPPGDDTTAMVECLGALGVVVTLESHDARGSRGVVLGRGGLLVPGPVTLHARLAGTTSRFVTALAALGPGPYVVDGEPPLQARPMGPLHAALGALGATVRPLGGSGRLPVEVDGPASGGRVAIGGDVSSQYVTALMLIGPYLPDGLHVELTSPLVSRPYVEMTRAVMAAFGVDRVSVSESRVEVAAGRYAPTTYHVEPDATSAGYPLAVAAVAGGAVTVEGLARPSLQGDVGFVELLATMGCRVEWGGDGVTVARDPGAELAGIDVDMADMSDLVPTLAVVALRASSPTRIRGVGFIRGKESDRLGDLAVELARLGAAVDVLDDGLRIDPAAGRLHGARLATHHDHRLAMAFGVLGVAVGGIEVEDPSVVTKSWPGYWQVLDAIAASATGAGDP